jgi:hypothetical protein
MGLDDKTDDDPKQIERADGHERERDADQHLDDDDCRSPINVDNFPRDRRIPAGRLIFDAVVISPALTRRRPLRWPIPFFCVRVHPASIAHGTDNGEPL